MKGPMSGRNAAGGICMAKARFVEREMRKVGICGRWGYALGWLLNEWRGGDSGAWM